MMATVAHSDEAVHDQAGTPPGDRDFRPDVQGLRAIAILLVVLFHADVPGISGGYVGVDVFFVISGFVITGVLLREQDSRRRISILNFYGRRARRIIPAASLVIIVTVVAAFHYLGSLTGHETAVDGQWAAVFLANFHFAASQTNYLASQQPPSSLQNFWSLAVEEQFYVVYPTIFLLTVGFASRFSARLRLTFLLSAIIVASYAYSVVFTAANPSSAFFSPFTRAWELALGALIAVSGPTLRRLPSRAAALISWAGFVAIVVSSVTLTSASVYPGALVIFPVVGAGLIIAGGVARPTWGVERLLSRRPFQLLGLISYSLYLWHWPILIIVTQDRGATELPVWENLVLILIATGVAALTYRLLENPVRHARFLLQRRWASVLMGLCLIGATLVVTTYEEQRPAFSLGAIASATTGSPCPEPNHDVVSSLRSRYDSGHAHAAGQSVGAQSVVLIGDSTACTLLPGLQAVGPSYGLSFEDGAVIGCGVVSGEIAPLYNKLGTNVSLPTKQCQGEANRAEMQAIERYRPRLIVWGSTEEHGSVVDTTASGSKVVNAGTPAWKSVMLQRMDNRVQEFLSTGANVVLLLEPPSLHAGSGFDATDLAYQQMNDILKEVAARHPHRVALVNLATRVCPSGPPCPVAPPGWVAKGNSVGQYIASGVRPDTIHYSENSSLWVARWLVPHIAAARRGLT
jgi:peptidoglycan/LPS O-acetylase OafA/YrhL